MPSHDIKAALEAKPVVFTLKTNGGKWKCTIHGNRDKLEKARATQEPTPGIARTDSGMSVSSDSSTASSGSSTTSSTK